MPLRPGIERSSTTASNGCGRASRARRRRRRPRRPDPGESGPRGSRGSLFAPRRDRRRAAPGTRPHATCDRHGGWGGATETELRSSSKLPRRSPTSGAGSGPSRRAQVTWSDELYRIYGFEPRSMTITLELFLSLAPSRRPRAHPARDPERVLQHAAAVRAIASVSCAPTAPRARSTRSARSLADEHGASSRLVGTCRDITEVVARDERLRFYADMFEHAVVGLSAWQSIDAVRRMLPARRVQRRASSSSLGRPARPRARQPLAEIAPDARAARLDGRRERHARLRPYPPHAAPTRLAVPRARRCSPCRASHVGLALEDVTGACSRACARRPSERRALEMLAAARRSPTSSTMIAQRDRGAPRSARSARSCCSTRPARAIGHGAAPSLPRRVQPALDGPTIGPRAGSCGTAMYRREPVIVEDIETRSAVGGLPRARPRARPARRAGRARSSAATAACSARSRSTTASRGARRRARIEADQARRARHGDRDRAPRARRRAARARRPHRGGPRGRAHRDRARHPRPARPGAHRAQARRRLAAAPDRATRSIRRQARGHGAARPTTCSRTVRRISADLRPGVLDDARPARRDRVAGRGVRAPHRHAVQGASRTSPISSSSATSSTNVFRIFQEALTNIARHAAASHVEVSAAPRARPAPARDRRRRRRRARDRAARHARSASSACASARGGSAATARSSAARRAARSSRVSVPLRFPAERASG